MKKEPDKLINFNLQKILSLKNHIKSLIDNYNISLKDNKYR